MIEFYGGSRSLMICHGLTQTFMVFVSIPLLVDELGHRNWQVLSSITNWPAEDTGLRASLEYRLCCKGVRATGVGQQALDPPHESTLDMLHASPRRDGVLTCVYRGNAMDAKVPSPQRTNASRPDGSPQFVWGGSTLWFTPVRMGRVARAALLLQGSPRSRLKVEQSACCYCRLQPYKALPKQRCVCDGGGSKSNCNHLKPGDLWNPHKGQCRGQTMPS